MQYFECFRTNKFCAFLFLFVFISLGLNAQERDWENSNLRFKEIIATDSIQLDHSLIIPDKIQILKGGEILTNNLYRIDFENSFIYFDESLNGEKISIQYYTFPNTEIVEFSKDTALIIEPQETPKLYSILNEKRQPNNLFEGLNSRGSLIRGITFGNNQGASVQSSLDLQLSGKLSEDVFINAAISDNNVPIETDGYTQTLQDFDQIFVEIYNKNSKIRAGHLDLLQTEDFFGNFAEKVTGLQVGTQIDAEKFTTNISAAGSVSRGEFVQVRFNGQEGNQGPYRLSGNNNELFIIVLSGSERVYIDGILMQRGQDQDYIINYNTGELTFTSNRLITANSRILVEYLYADRNYSRFLFYGGAETKSERFRIAAHFYSNGDSKGNPINQSLSDEDLEILTNAGDDTTQMISSTAEAATFDPERIQYRQITVGGNSIFEYTTDPNETVFNVTFSFVGSNNGNYVQTNLDTNGRIFSYVAPIGGVPQGDYEPIQQLVAPERLQMYTLNSNYNFKKGGQIGVDLAMSNKDLNLFSSVDNNDNIGLAARVYSNKTFKHKQWKFNPRVEYSFIQDQFNAIQRIRYEEFIRDFNLQSEIDTVNQHYLQFQFNSEYKENFRFRYGLDFLENQNVYSGLRNKLDANYKTDKTNIYANASLLNTDGNNQNSSFREFFAVAEQKLGKSFWIGSQFESEDNQIKDDTTDTFTNNSFRWNQLNFRAGVGDSTKLFTTLDLYTRKDDSVRLGNLQNLSKARGIVLQSRLLNKSSHQLSLNGHFRAVNYANEDQTDEDFVTGNVNWYKSFWSNGLIFNAFYELESGREQQREFEYVQVTDGLGIYKWTDYNGDGIEQIDEFEIAEFQDQANYIRVYTNTINSISTNKNRFTFSGNVQPKYIFPKNKFLKRWLLQFSLQTFNSALKEEKTLEWNPFLDEEDLLSKTRNYRFNLFYNRGNRYKWSTNYTYTIQTNQNFVFTGRETRENRTHLFQLKHKPLDNLIAVLDLEQSNLNSNSDVFAARRYEISSYSVLPSITYKIGKSFNASINYQFQSKENGLSIEKLNQSEFRGEVQWNNKNRSLFANFSYVNNQFTGDQNSVVGNQMMEGLRAGNNFVWQFLFQQQITSYLNINLTYNGRKTEISDTIHSGSVQMQIRF